MSYSLRGNHLCVAILAACRDEPLTAAELSKRLDLRLDAARYWLAGLAQIGLLHVVEWRKGIQGPSPATYAFGAAESVAPPKARKPRPVSMANLGAFKALWEQLQGEPSTQAELCEASGMAVGTVRRLLVAMRAARLVRLAEWQVRVGCGGVATPMFQVGAAPDAPKPKPRTQAQHCRAYYARQKTAAYASKKLAENMADMRSTA
jgi:hypothetical protein